MKKVVNRIYRRGYIPKEMQQYLLPRYSGPGKLKGNPKLHKEKAPLRTIVSGLNIATERIAELAEHELNEFVESSPSFLRDTTDFILKLHDIQEPLPENSILFCFDVQKLYPSIPKIEGLDACREAQERKTKPLVNSTYEMLDVITTVLDNNNFSLGDIHYVIVRLSLLTMTNPNQLCGVLLFVCSKMADETNVSSKLPVACKARSWSYLY